MRGCPCREQCFECPCNVYKCAILIDPDTPSGIKPTSNDAIFSLTKQPILYASDEFNSDELNDFWKASQSNQFLQSNVQLDNGRLKLLFTDENGEYKGGRVNMKYNPATEAAHERTFDPFGFFEVRAKISDGIGRSSIFQIYPVDGFTPDGVEDPTARKGAEISIVMGSKTTAEYQIKIGYKVAAGADLTNELFTVTAPNLWDGLFHTFGLYWESDFLKFYFDGNLVLTVTDENLIPQTEHMPRLSANMASWQNGGPGEADWPATFEIDWIRMYKLGMYLVLILKFDI